MSEHTPGPWSLVAKSPDPKGHGYYVEAATPQTRRPICDIAYTLDVDEANARLISAAPDLLAALEGLLDNPRSQKAVEAAINAIEKATGRPVEDVPIAKAKETTS